ncbi:MAG: GIY-YIG nuclease family protein [Gammaproteobacteria bacterium]|nr:GIY-YIG nuclease family protein [Gammaproteobacteria bacterium]
MTSDAPAPPVWHLYLVRTRFDTLYTGIATDVERRFAEHRDGRQGARYLRAKGPLELVYRVKIGEHGLALRAEHRLKQLPKAAKENVVATKLRRKALLVRLGLDQQSSAEA